MENNEKKIVKGLIRRRLRSSKMMDAMIYVVRHRTLADSINHLLIKGGDK